MWVVDMGDESHSNCETPCSWCIQAHNHNQWLRSALSEMEKTTKGMQAIMNPDDDAAETYHQKRPELLEMVEEFRRSYHILADYCTHLSIRSTQSGSSLSHPGSSFKSATNKTPSSTPDSSAELPDVDGARAAAPEELSREVERTVGELARRNQEKREAKRELQARVHRLVEENGVLRRRLREAAQENAALLAGLVSPRQGKTAILDSPSSVGAAKRSRLSRLRTVILRSCASGV